MDDEIWSTAREWMKDESVDDVVITQTDEQMKSAKRLRSMMTDMQARQYEYDSNKRGGYNG